MKFPEFSNASCRGIGTEFYFTEDDKQPGSSPEMAMAKALCQNCPVLKECREWGIKHEEFGIWGGLNPYDRRRVRRQRNIKLQQILVSDYI